MTLPSAHYNLTRRKGQRATVSLFVNTAVNHETLQRDEQRTVVNVRRVVKQPTNYARIARARAAQTDIGETLFIFWLRDVPFTRLTPEDYIICEGVRYDFVESTIEEDGLVATAKAIVGATPIQTVSVSVSQSVVSDSVEVEE